MCEGVWRNRTGQRVVITQCEPVGGQQWTDGFELYSDDGKYYQSQREDSQDLVAFVGLLPDSSQRAPVSRPAETESTTAVAGGVSDDPGRIIYELEERLAAETERTEQAQRYISTNELLNEKAAEIEQLRTELQQTEAWRTAATDAYSQSETLRIEQQTEIERLKADNEQLKSANEYIATLERLLDDARDNLRVLEADGTAMDHHCEGMKAAYLAVIKTLTGGRA
jgi:molecular chaperone GrpE (heat shock protein)